MKYLADKGVQPRRIRLSQAGPYEPKMAGGGDEVSLPQGRVEIYALNEIAYEPAGAKESVPDNSQKVDIKRKTRERNVR